MALHHWVAPWPDVATEPEDQYIIASGIPADDKRLVAYKAMLRKRNEFLEHTVDADLFELAQGASPTDMLTKLVQPYRTMVVSDRLKNILGHFDLFDHRLHPLRIRHGEGHTLNYWMLEWRDDVIEYIDFARSSFSKVDMFLRAATVALPIRSLAEYREQQIAINKEALGSFWTIRGDMLVFAKNDWTGQDMFDLGSLNPIMQQGPIISDRLLGALLDAGIIGVQFSRVGHIQHR
jgi:hypothetical protein